jgi:DNA (cytosine-5)-methyltransferase 1
MVLPMETPLVELVETRVCSRCKVAKPLSEFTTDKRKPGGKGYHCKPCRSEYVAGRPVKWPPPPYEDVIASAARAAIAKQGRLHRPPPWPRGGKFRVGSIATGAGGLELGVSQVLETELAWVCDDDPDCEELLARRFPGVRNLGDAELVAWRDVPPVDMLVAGIPCQPYSHAGNMLEEEDDRDLWPAVSIAIRRLQPGYVFIENVAGFLRRGLGLAVRDLAQAGYVGRWGCVRALDVEAPHVRDRVFVLAAHPDALDRWSSDRAGAHQASGRADHDGDGAHRQGDLHGGGGAGPRAGWGPFQQPIERWSARRGDAPTLMVDGLGLPNAEFLEWVMGFPIGWTRGLDRVDRIAMMANACVPAQAAEALDRLLG